MIEGVLDMSKLNYSTAKHLARMIRKHLKTQEGLLKEVEFYRKGILGLARELRDLLEEAHKQSDKT